MSANYTMTINQGEDYLLTLTIEDSVPNPIDLTNYEFTGQIRSKASSTDILASFTITKLNQGTNPGELTIELSAATSSALTMDTSTKAKRKITEMAYDIESIESATDTVRWLEGVVRMSPEVTR